MVVAAALVVVPRFANAQQQALPSSVNFGTHGIGTVFNAVGTGLASVASTRGGIAWWCSPSPGLPPGSLQ